MKHYVKPEFQVIRQNEANAKFFVASGEPDYVNAPESMNPDPEDSGAASQYGEGSGLSM